MHYRLAIGITIFGTVIAFQNCARSEKLSDASDSGDKAAIVIGPTHSFTKVVFDPGLEAVSPKNYGRAETDLISGEVRLTLTSSTAVHQCALDTQRLAQLRAILATASVCKPGPPPSGYATCLAFAPPDIELSNSTSSELLARVICNNGRFLCDGKDDELRALLGSLFVNPPAGCG